VAIATSRTVTIKLRHYLFQTMIFRSCEHEPRLPRKRPRSFRMSVFGHEERFPPTRLSAGCGLRKETIAGMRRKRARCADSGWSVGQGALTLADVFIWRIS
jgi:hypothetical protein